MKLSLKQYWALLSRHLQPQRRRFTLLVALLLGSIGLQIINPQITGRFIDAALAGQPLESLLLLAVTFLGIALLQQGLSVGATYVGENVAWTATNALRADLARHCLGLDLGFHNRMTPGELIERIDGDVAKMAGLFSEIVIQVLGNLLLLGGIVLAVCLKDWRAGLVAALFTAVAVLFLGRFRGLAIPAQKALREASANLFGFLEERLAGAEEIRPSGAVDFILRGLYRLQYAYMRADLRAGQMQFATQSILRALLMVGNVLALVGGYLLFHQGGITLGTVYLFFSYATLLSQPIRELTHQVARFQGAGASLERIQELLRLESRVQDGAGAALPAGPLALSFEDVSFAYGTAEPVLRDVAFRLEPGRVLGLLGRTGSGKTTLARLVLRLYDPTAGRVLLDGTDARQPRLHDLRRRVALVTQDVQLFQASLRDNLTFFDPTVPDDAIVAALQALELGEWYRALPAGLDTQLEAAGRGLSAGEAQLLAFTRVLLRNPGLIVLDEAASRIDPATEQRIERAIGRLLQGRTAIVIAHRLHTVHRADEIMILDEGQVVEWGERAHLAAEPGSHFYRLLQTGLEEVLA